MRLLRSKIQIVTSMTSIKTLMTSINTSMISIKDPNDLKNDLEIRLSELIRKNPELTYKALGEALAVSTATIKRTLTKMQRGGKVVREGSNRKGKWILTDKMK